MTLDPPRLVSAALLLRDDGRVLLVRRRPGDEPFGGQWAPPLDLVQEAETAEDVVARVLRERLRVDAGPVEFTETLYAAGADGARHIVNVFTCVEWRGEPRFSEGDYGDGAWVDPAALGTLEVAPEVHDWLATAFAGAAPVTDPQALTAALAEARSALLAAFDAVPADGRARALDGEWSAVDVLAHAASMEAYYRAEARRLLEVPGHTWQTFNPAQWDEDRRLRGPEPEADVRSRLAAAREATLGWLSTLGEEELATYGNHAERGAVTIAGRIHEIARHDLEHAEQLRAMGGAAGKDGAASADAREPGAGDAAADR